MMTTSDTIRPIRTSDLDWILELNRVHERELSPLDRDGLVRLVETAFCGLVCEPQAAFLIAFGQEAAYESPNFLWFRERYPTFVYVDRIAVSGQHRGGGIARHLYQALFREAADAGRERICCEVNLSPPNPASDRFHAAMGFDRVGEAELAGGGKTVAYYLRELEA